MPVCKMKGKLTISAFLIMAGCCCRTEACVPYFEVTEDQLVREGMDETFRFSVNYDRTDNSSSCLDSIEKTTISISKINDAGSDVFTPCSVDLDPESSSRMCNKTCSRTDHGLDCALTLDFYRTTTRWKLRAVFGASIPDKIFTVNTCVPYFVAPEDQIVAEEMNETFQFSVNYNRPVKGCLDHLKKTTVSISNINDAGSDVSTPCAVDLNAESTPRMCNRTCIWTDRGLDCALTLVFYRTTTRWRLRAVLGVSIPEKIVTVNVACVPYFEAPENQTVAEGVNETFRFSVIYNRTLDGRSCLKNMKKTSVTISNINDAGTDVFTPCAVDLDPWSPSRICSKTCIWTDRGLDCAVTMVFHRTTTRWKLRAVFGASIPEKIFTVNVTSVA